MRHRAGHLIDIELSIEQVEYNHRPCLLLIGVDISQRKQAEARLEQALQQQELLLKEVHHRVRNNLHLITNLLDLQAGALQDDRLLQQFATTQHRIQAMTLIYELLYKSQDMTRIDLGDYLNQLTLTVFQDFQDQSHSSASIQPVIAVEPILLNLETAVPCGLLVNELLVNCLKHAFPEGRSGQISVHLSRLDRQLQIQVQDNGIGLAPYLEQNPTSLGFRLVHILAKQLKATVQFDRSTGTAITITFSELQYSHRF